uniref:Ubiquitin-protein ligase, putative n=1 Tax=Arundo donax TaxID=35708 RepID=A0A0A9D4S9_ARUDO
MSRSLDKSNAHLVSPAAVTPGGGCFIFSRQESTILIRSNFSDSVVRWNATKRISR